jgi:hypothetical protein
MKSHKNTQNMEYFKSEERIYMELKITNTFQSHRFRISRELNARNRMEKSN